jgi:spoIIIJ-associated protein
VNEREFTGKNLEDAKRHALDSMNVTEDKVEFTIVRKGRPGILGMKAEDAKVIVRLIEDNAPSMDVNPEITPDIRNEAKIILEDLARLLGLEAKVKVIPPAQVEDPLTLNLEGDDLGVLIGRRGQTLSSLQYVVRLILSEKFKKWISVNVDVAEYKKRRYESLAKLALRLADQVKTTRRSMNLEPMPPDERRIIHLTLADYPDVTTQSVDQGEKRKVVIQYRKR